MPVYLYRTMNLLQESLKSVAEEFFSTMYLKLTHEEFLAAFINPDHIAKLQEVQELTGFIGGSKTATLLHCRDGAGAVAPAIDFVGLPPVILPRYIVNGVQPTCPQDLFDKIHDWSDQRYEIGRALGLVSNALQWLNDNCADTASMSTLLPCFPMLLARTDTREDSRTAKAAAKLASSNRVGTLPKMPRAMKNELQAASALVSSVVLIGDAQKSDPVAGDVILSASIYAARTRPPQSVALTMMDTSFGQGPIF